MSVALVSSSAPQPGAISTTDRGHSVSAKTGRQHESCRIVAIGSRRCAMILHAGRTFCALPGTKVASRTSNSCTYQFLGAGGGTTYSLILTKPNEVANCGGLAPAISS